MVPKERREKGKERERVRERGGGEGLEEREGWGNIMNNIRGGYFL